MSLFKKILQAIPAGLGLLGQAIGIKPTTVKIQHIGPPHQYDTFGMCVRCDRFDTSKIEYTKPPCPRTRTPQELP